MTQETAQIVTAKKWESASVPFHKDLERIKMEELVDEKIVIHEFQMRENEQEQVVNGEKVMVKGRFALLRITHEGAEKTTAVGSAPVLRDLEHNEPNLPLECRVTLNQSMKNKGRSYYLFTPL